MMRIAIDAHTINKNFKAGIYVGTADLLTALVKIDSDNDYQLYFRGGVSNNLRFISERFHVKKLYCPDNLVFGRDIFLSLVPLALTCRLSSDRPDLFFAPTPFYPLHCCCPSVVKVHDVAALKSDAYFETVNKIAYKQMLLYAVKRATRVIAISQWTKTELINHTGIDPDKIEVIYRTHNSDMYWPRKDEKQICAVGQKYGIEGGYILYLGTLEPRKNLARLIKAFDILRKKHGLPHKLVIAGAQGWLYSDIYATINQLRLNDDVIFTGYVPEDLLPVLLSAADVLAYPSLYEGFGLPPLQAMACGTPVVSSNVTSIPEVVGDAAVFVDPYNIDEIALALLSVLQDIKLRDELSIKGIKRAKLFSMEKEATQHLELFNSLWV